MPPSSFQHICKRQALVILLGLLCAVACAQERDDESGAAQIENNDKDAAKRAKKAERKSRKDKKSGNRVQLPPAPDLPAEFEFFDGAIFSRKVNLGMKSILCFASERRPVAMIWKEGQEGSTATGNLPVKFSARELQLIFGRSIDASRISVLNENGAMLSRGAAAQVAFNLGRKPIYLLVETMPSRPKASTIPLKSN